MTTIRKKKKLNKFFKNKFLSFFQSGGGGYKLGLLLMAEDVQDIGSVHPKCNLTFQTVLVCI